MGRPRDIADSASVINALDGVTATGAEINTLDGITSTTAELNILDGVTSTAAELNILDGVTSTTSELNILDGVTSTAAELNILDGVTSTAAELNILDGVTATTAELNYVDGVTSNIQTQLNNISPSPTFTATASGALANGDVVCVNTDGTVSAIADNSVSTSNGSAVNFVDINNMDELTVGADSNLGKVLVFYRDSNDSPNRGFAVVGTISGTTISFGTPVGWTTSYPQWVRATFDSTANKVIVAYRGSSSLIGCRVFTISGTSVSAGSEATVHAGLTSGLAIAYDSNSDRTVVFYEDDGNSDALTAKVGTVSGTSISFGSAAVVDGNPEGWDATFDSNSNKVVVSFRDTNNSNYPTVRVGTVSGTSISFGSAVVLTSTGVTETSIAFDSDTNLIMVAYRNGSNLYYKAGSVSGTSISFGSQVSGQTTLKDTNAGNFRGIDTSYDATAKKFVTTYHDTSNYGRYQAVKFTSTSSSTVDSQVYLANVRNGDSFISSTYLGGSIGKIVTVYETSSGAGAGIVSAVAFTDQNLTAENYIGIADAAYSNGASATIQIAGAVDDAQSSLTAGQTYYVQNDGTLSQSADSPSVVAGTAVSATQIIVKG